jgi:hypothetical protein
VLEQEPTAIFVDLLAVVFSRFFHQPEVDIDAKAMKSALLILHGWRVALHFLIIIRKVLSLLVFPGVMEVHQRSMHFVTDGHSSRMVAFSVQLLALDS